MKIIARCHPLLEPILPKPIMAKAALPGWLKAMPGKVLSDTLGGEEVRTLKHCPPIIDGMSNGILIPLVTDIAIKDGHVSWDWEPPILENAALSRSPIGVHVPEQAQGSSIKTNGQLILKFTNFWTFEVSEEWQLLFVHPLNRTDLPFNTLSGLVDCNGFKDGYVHFPALLDPTFEGVIKKGTPIVQVIAVPYQAMELEITTMSEKKITKNAEIQSELQKETGVYRKKYKR